MATWITSDGQFKVESVRTIDKGQFVTVWRWASVAQEWIWAKPDIQPPLGLSPNKLGEYLLGELCRKGIDPHDLIECDDPDWEDEAGRGEFSHDDLGSLPASRVKV